MKRLGYNINRYWRVWRRGIFLHFGVLAATRSDFFFFFVGKIFRMAFFVIFCLSLFRVTDSIAGYSKAEVLLFFSTMNIIDIIVQILWFRGLTVLPQMVKKGDFDFLLTQPMSPLFIVAFRIFDLFDLTTIPAAALIFWYSVSILPAYPLSAWLMYGLFVVCGLLLAFALNLFLASLTFYAVESSNLWWMYRDLIYVARFPPEVFPNAVQFLFTYIIPILVIVSFPTKALLGRLTFGTGIYALVLSALALVLAWKFWHRGLRAYASASS